MFAYDFSFDVLDSFESDDALFFDYMENDVIEDIDAWKLCELD